MRRPTKLPHPFQLLPVKPFEQAHNVAVYSPPGLDQLSYFFRPPLLLRITEAASETAVEALTAANPAARLGTKNESLTGIAHPIKYHALVWQADTPQRRKYRASKALHSKIGLLSPLLQLINSVLHRPCGKGK
jgi:hypothetical protein